MTKINIGLIGIVIIIVLVLVSHYNLNSKNKDLYEELTIIKSFLEDIDNDIHEIEKKIEK
tara:strand:+ start:156 stop:335 length:180 start_codon:yes stop_codon:yes gene_type:complete